MFSFLKPEATYVFMLSEKNAQVIDRFYIFMFASVVFMFLCFPLYFYVFLTCPDRVLVYVFLYFPIPTRHSAIL